MKKWFALAVLFAVSPLFAADDAAPAAAAPVAQKVMKKSSAGSEEAGIKATFEKFSKAWADGDAKARAACFTTDATLINPFGVAANGRGEIEKLFEAENKTIANGTTHVFDNFKFVRIMGNMYLVDCDGTVSGLKDPAGNPAPDVKLHVFGVVVNRTGVWQMRAARPAIYAPMPGAPAAAAAPMGEAPAAPPATDITAPPAEDAPALDKEKK
ncbi:MAG TPA: SgcJ/EcaC family oxidoreductase [bacterium]|nr:SgcJ/EcaC family oxidoreductase [bacterium]